MVEKFNQIDELEILIYSKKNNNKLISDLTKKTRLFTANYQTYQLLEE